MTPSKDSQLLAPRKNRDKGFIAVTAIVALALTLLAGALLKLDPANIASFFKTAIIFVITLGVLVFVHEWGHYQFARWSGMKVNRFAIGFPPFIYNTRRNGITYSIGALPIGGLVDIAGLGSEEEMVSHVKGEDVPAPIRDRSRPFGQRQFQDGSLFARFMVLFAGPMMNFLLAMILFVFVYSVFGVSEATLKGMVGDVRSNSPAATAGLQPGDEITAVGSKTTPNQDDVISAIRNGTTEPTTLTIVRKGKTLQVPITPEMFDPTGSGKKVPSIGITMDGGMNPEAIRSFSYTKVSPVMAVKLGFYDSIGTSLQILDTVKRALTRNLQPQEVKGIGGPVKIAQTMGQAASFGPGVLLRMAAMLSVNLGLLNLLPLPALDGGRILFLGFELVMRRPVPARIEGVVHAAGMVMLLAFMLFITLRDVIPFKS